MVSDCLTKTIGNDGVERGQSAKFGDGACEQRGQIAPVAV